MIGEQAFGVHDVTLPSRSAEDAVQERCSQLARVQKKDPQEEQWCGNLFPQRQNEQICMGVLMSKQVWNR